MEKQQMHVEWSMRIAEEQSGAQTNTYTHTVTHKQNDSQQS